MVEVGRKLEADYQNKWSILFGEDSVTYLIGQEQKFALICSHSSGGAKKPKIGEEQESQCCWVGWPPSVKARVLSCTLSLPWETTGPDQGREKAALILSWLFAVFYSEAEMKPRERAWRMNFPAQGRINECCDSRGCMEHKSNVVKPKPQNPVEKLSIKKNLAPSGAS